MGAIYNWERFWCPREGKLSFSDNGFLYDPDSEWGDVYNPDVVSFISIEKTPCLILLGEPGIGKSTALQAEYEAFKSKSDEMKIKSLPIIDLRSYGSEDRLVRDVFENEIFKSWAKDQTRLCLFLDSFDECLLQIKTLAALLTNEFKKYPTERLLLRIACRTAEFPTFFEENIKDIWGENRVGIFELAPLRKNDVIEAANINKLNSDVFIDDIIRNNLQSLASKPITLNFLIYNFRKENKFPDTQKELYFKGCQLLCEETSESRRGAGQVGLLSADQKMIVAARIAAATLFSNKYAIWTDLDLGNVPVEDVTIRELIHGKERVAESEFEIDENAIRESLNTGLFTSRGSNRIGWAHQTYSEFLAAWYLMQYNVATNQIMSLLIHPDDSDNRLIPQLHQVAAWLSIMNLDVFNQVAAIDPEVLLISDVSTREENDRAFLVKNLLKHIDEEKSLDTFRQGYEKLAHRNLAKQLKPYILDKTKGIMVRKAATDIAEACNLKGLQDDIAKVALDKEEQLAIRVNAAYAVERIADDKTKKKLMQFIKTDSSEEDPYDELKGCALRALWPDLIDVGRLFSVLTPPKRDNFAGAYIYFIGYELVKSIRAKDIPSALQWVERQSSRRELPYSFKDLIDEIMVKAWDNLNSDGVLKNYAKAILARLKYHDTLVEKQEYDFRNKIKRSSKKRRLIAKTIIDILKNPDDSWLLLFSGLILPADFSWMIEQLVNNSTSVNAQKAWTNLILRQLDYSNVSQTEAVFEASKQNPILHEEFEKTIRPIEIDSVEANKMKADYKRRQEFENYGKKRHLLEPTPKERILNLLDSFESGNLDAWWKMNREMTLVEDSTHYGNKHQVLVQLPGWKTADDFTKERIRKASKIYILKYKLNQYDWIATNDLHRPAIAGLKALDLLLREDPDFVLNIKPEVWKKWAPTVLNYQISENETEEKLYLNLVGLAYKNAPNEILDTADKLMDKENQDHGYIFITYHLKHCWDERLANGLLKKAKDKNLTPISMGRLLGDLLDHNNDSARKYAEALIFKRANSEQQEERAIIASQKLITHSADAGWHFIWPIICNEIEFGKSVLLGIAYEDRRTDSVINKLSEEQLADLYIWLETQFPRSEDPEISGSVTPRMDIGRWRNRLLRYLSERGTKKACEAIQRIIDNFPNFQWLKWQLLEAQTNTRRNSWIAPAPDDIIRLISSRDLRFVRNGDDLLELIIESLKRLEKKLQGETPQAFSLWDKVDHSIYKPKEENLLSDLIKIHLDDDLKKEKIIVNREVEIRRSQRTDIKVQANSHTEPSDKLSLIVEVKGCWNNELATAMRTQLVDRYLKENYCNYGLYIVGWFNCDLWDKNDYKKKEVLKHESLEKLKDKLNNQAQELSQNNTYIRSFVLDCRLK